MISLGKDGREGALSVIGAVSPPGGDISEPVSQATLRIVKVFWGLDSALAYKRHFPAINWLNSYSLYLDDMETWFNANVASDWMEAARSIREDFLHQNSFHEIDTYTSLKKQHMMMKLVMAFYEKAVEALSGGASLQDLINMPVREQIGRFKYVHEDDLDTEYEKVNQELDAEISAAQGKEGF